MEFRPMIVSVGLTEVLLQSFKSSKTQIIQQHVEQMGQAVTNKLSDMDTPDTLYITLIVDNTFFKGNFNSLRLDNDET